jgi:hypothetical protein
MEYSELGVVLVMQDSDNDGIWSMNYFFIAGGVI